MKIPGTSGRPRRTACLPARTLRGLGEQPAVQEMYPQKVKAIPHNSRLTAQAPLRRLRHGICVAKMLDNVGLRYPHRASGAKAPRTLQPLPLLRFAVSATGGAHLCSIQYYLRFWLSSCRTSLTVSALRIMRYCHKDIWKSERNVVCGMASHTGKIDMIRGSIIKSAALFALPICVGNILQQLYGTVDTLVVGNFCDSAALAAVGTATQPMEILLCVFLGIGNGASILVSQEMGRRNADGLRMLVRTTVWFLYLCAIPVTILAMFVGPALLRLMQVPADAFDYAVLYLRITALGTLGNLGYNMNAGILRGLGDSRSTLLLLLISCLTNIVLDVAFVAVLGMGVAGAALATTIALYLSWLTSILYARRNYEGLQFPLLPHGYNKAQLAAILKVGVPLGLNNSLYSVGHVAVQAVYNMQGSVFVAGCSIAGRVTGIAGIAITSFSSAAVVFAGQNLGAGNYRRLQQGVVQITCAAGVVTLLIGLVATVFCRPLLGLFSSDPAVLDAAVRYTWWVLPFIWTYAVFNCMMSFVNGTGAVKYTTVVNLLILWAVRIPAAYILHALGYGTSSMACVSLSYTVGLVAMLGYFLTPEWGKLRRKAKELGDAVTAETEPTL